MPTDKSSLLSDLNTGILLCVRIMMRLFNPLFLLGLSTLLILKNVGGKGTYRQTLWTALFMGILYLIMILGTMLLVFVHWIRANIEQPGRGDKGFFKVQGYE